MTSSRRLRLLDNSCSLSVYACVASPTGSSRQRYYTHTLKPCKNWHCGSPFGLLATCQWCRPCRSPSVSRRAYLNAPAHGRKRQRYFHNIYVISKNTCNRRCFSSSKHIFPAGRRYLQGLCRYRTICRFIFCPYHRRAERLTSWDAISVRYQRMVGNSPLVRIGRILGFSESGARNRARNSS